MNSISSSLPSFLPSSLQQQQQQQQQQQLSFLSSSSSSSAMAISIGFTPSTRSSSDIPRINLNRSSSSFSSIRRLSVPSSSSNFGISASLSSSSSSLLRFQPVKSSKRSFIAFSSGGGNNGGSNSGGGGGGSGGSGGGGGGGGNGDGEEDASDKNKAEALLALAQIGRSLESIPSDLAAAIEDGRIPATIVNRYLNLEKSGAFRWLLQFGGFKERLLADDLFFAKVFMECGIGIFTKTAAEYERRRENFMKELDFVVADVVMAIIADFMLVWLPAPTVSLRPALNMNAGTIAKFFYSCPDNAFQIALAGTSYSFIQRLGSIMRNGAKLFAVGTSASLVGTAATNALIRARKAVDKSSDSDEVHEVPIIATSVAYGVYMAVSSNLRYQLLAGVVEQRILEPMLHKHKVLLSALCFAVRTGNTFLGSLLWVDYARLIGIQKVQE